MHVFVNSRVSAPFVRNAHVHQDQMYRDEGGTVIKMNYENDWWGS